MVNGPSLADFQQAKISPEFKASSRNFTSFSGDMLREAQATIPRSPENGAVTLSEPPRYQEDPTVSMSSQDKELTDRLMAQIMEKPIPKRQSEVVSQSEKKTSKEEKKAQGFLARLWEKIKNFFNPWR